jgi:mitochondrial import receptor subunit TOM70
MSASATSATSTPPSSIWDRITTWASENKPVAYTIAGTVVVITGAGVVYYLSESRRKRPVLPTDRKKSKKERRNEKKKAEEERKGGISLKDEEAGSNSILSADRVETDTLSAPVTSTSKAPIVEVEEELPQIDESNVDSFSQEVRIMHCLQADHFRLLTKIRTERHMRTSLRWPEIKPTDQKITTKQ